MQDSSSDDELFVGLGDAVGGRRRRHRRGRRRAVGTELETFRAVELACLEGRRITTEAGAALAIARRLVREISPKAPTAP